MTEPALTDPLFDNYRDNLREPLLIKRIHESDDLKQALGVQALIQKWQERLNLTDWEIRYDQGDPNGKRKEWQATQKYRETERVAQIRIDPDLPPEQLEGVVVHELLHLVLLPYTTLARTFAARHKQGALLLDLLHEEEEPVIEVLLRALVPSYERWLPYGSLVKMWPAFTR